MSIHDYPIEKLLHLYRQMLLVREFELRAISERRAGLIPGFIHSCVGQEATAAGVWRIESCACCVASAGLRSYWSRIPSPIQPPGRVRQSSRTPSWRFARARADLWD